MTTTFQRTGDEQVDRSLAGVVRGVQALERQPWNAGTLLEHVVLGTSDTPVIHGLGRPVRGYLVARASAAAQVSDGTASPSPATYVNLRASAPVTVSLIVF